MKDIKAVSHPIPTEIADRIYNENKTVFVSKSHLGKVSKGDKFIIYESHGAKAYTGWADIVKIEYMAPKNIINEYKDQLMVTSDEFKEYTKGREKINVILFENFEKFKKNVAPKRFVSVSGKYIYNDEFDMIKKNKE